jgi:predicted dehydrogenase
VRWTEQRNFEAILDMMAEGRIDMKPLISHRFKLDQAAEAYDLISSGNPLGVLLQYPAKPAKKIERTVTLNAPLPAVRASQASVGFIGAGGYASSVLVPAFAETGARLKSIASATGVSSVHVGKKNQIEEATTDTDSVLADEAINTLVITTRHNSHASWVRKGLEAGKHIFVEKPLTLTRQELDDLGSFYTAMDRAPLLMVGFNRRYSPLIQPIVQALARKSQPVSMVMTVNAGEIPADHWTQDMDVGGGRIIGEGCHFIDLLRYLANSCIVDVQARAMDSSCKDSVSILLSFANGSIGTVNYLANGNKGFPKERLEVFCGGGIAQVDNFRSLKAFGWPGLKSQRLWRQDKGQSNCTRAFVDAIEKGDSSALIPVDELLEVAHACFDVVDQIS